MGLFGGKGRDRELDRVTEEAQRLIDSGETEFVISVNLAEAGGRNGASAMAEMAVDRIRVAGGQVTDVDVEPWAGRARLAVVVPSGARSTGVVETGHTPSPAPAAAPTFDDPASLDRWLTQALLPWSSSDHDGATFGPGHGLEAATESIASVDHTHPFFQAVAQSAASIIIGWVRSKSIDFDDYDAALGLTPAGIARSGLSRGEAARVVQAAEESKTVIVGLSQGDLFSRDMSAWTSNPDVRRRCLVYHIVAIGRLSAEE